MPIMTTCGLRFLINFMSPSQETKKARIMVPSFYLIARKWWLNTSETKYKHFKGQKPVPWWPKIEPIKNLSPPVVVSGLEGLNWPFRLAGISEEASRISKWKILDHFSPPKKWTNQKNDPTSSRGWQNYAYTVNFVRFGQQTPELWPKSCPLVAKKWTLVKTDFARSTSAQCQ